MSHPTTPRPACVLGLGATLVLVVACGTTTSHSPGSPAPAPSAPSVKALGPPAATPPEAASSRPAPTFRAVRPVPGRTPPRAARAARTAAPRPGPATPTPPATHTGRSGVAPPTTTAPPTAAPTGDPRPSTSGRAVVPARKVPTKPPVALGRQAQVSDTVALEIASVTAVRARARMPGEISGPGVAVTVLVVNHSPHAVNVADTVVALTDSSRAPGGSVTDDRARPLSGVLPPGRTRTGSYIFTVPEDRRSPVTVTVTLTGESPVVQFVGNVT